MTRTLVLLTLVVAGCGADDPSHPPGDDLAVASDDLAMRDLGADDLAAPPNPWQTQAAGLTSVTLYAVSGAGSELFAVGDHGVILHTSDRGDHWTALTSGTPNVLLGVWTDGSVTVAVGYGGLVLRSVDHGDSWQASTLGGATLTAVTGSVASDDGGTVETVWVGGQDGLLARSDDGGLSFTPVSVVDATSVAAIFASAAETYAVTGSYVWRTRNGGAGWTGIDSEGGTAVWSNDAGEVVVPWVSIGGGQVRVTHDGGLTWTLAPGSNDFTGSPQGMVVAGGGAFVACAAKPGFVRVLSNDFSTFLGDEPLDGEPRAIWGTGGHDLFVVGDAGYIARRQ